MSQSMRHTNGNDCAQKPAANCAAETMLLAVLAACSLEVVRIESHGLCIAVLAGILAMATALGMLHRWLSNPGRPVSLLAATGGLVAAATTPLIIEVACAAALGHNQPLEFYLHAWFRNLMFGLVVMPNRYGLQRLGGLASLFLLVFASSLATSVARWFVVLPYTAIGAWWLMGVYWRPLEQNLATVHASHSQKSGWGMRVAIITAIPLLLATAVVFFGGASATIALNGFMPTSGGNRCYSESARAGVNDGDAMIAGQQNASSFGPVETDLFLASDQQSLYDMFNEIYGEPQKIKKLERAIALDSDNQPAREELRAQNEAIRREFSTVRQKSSQPQQKKLCNREADALFYVAGRTPLHLRMETYDRFDGANWSHGDVHHPADHLTIRDNQGLPWLDTHLMAGRRVFADKEQHTIKTSRLKSNRVPAPLHLTALHIAKVDRADFFSWSNDAVLQMNRECIPSFTVLRMESQVAAPDLLENATISNLMDAEAENLAGFLDVPKPPDNIPPLTQLAESWTDGSVRGWRQIQAITERLQTEYAVDDEAVAPADCTDAVSHFLLKAKRGPDYLFASAATLLLRSLGHPARTVSGFYAHPEHYNRISRHTPVTKQDVHFWTEVYVGCNTWLSVEPTPGYALLRPRRTWSELFCDSWSTAIDWCWRHWTIVVALTIAAALTFRFRREWSDFLARIIWRLAALRSPKHCVLATLWLFERRSRAVGLPRPPHETLLRWYASFALAAGEPARRELLEFVAVAEQSLYRTDPARRCSLWPREESRCVREKCRLAENLWTLRQFRSAKSEKTAATQNPMPCKTLSKTAQSRPLETVTS